MAKKIRILVAEDHTIVRMGIVSLLETEEDIKVIGVADDGDSAVKKALKLKPDVTLMDLMMPVMDGIEATREIVNRLPLTKVLILTTSTVSDEISRALKNGASGAITKNAPYKELIAAIHAVHEGRQSVSDDIQRILTDDPPVTHLSPRQTEILQSITRGLTTTDIAKQLDISPTSVKEHINALLLKLGAANRSEAVAIALRKHLLKI